MGNTSTLSRNVLWLSEVGMGDVESVGGKNASLGEMIRTLGEAGVSVPGGFATTADAFRDFLDSAGLAELIAQTLKGLDITDMGALAAAGTRIRDAIMAAPFTPEFERDIRTAYDELMKDMPNPDAVSWAVRSSATAEDLPDASFAGQHETYLNVAGIDNLLVAIKMVFASLFQDRAIVYRVHNGFDHNQVALSAAVQKMVRTDIGASGVMFTIDTESGFADTVFITAAYGLGEAVVQGAVNPDEFHVYKPGLAAGKKAILSRTLGEKAVKMTYTGDSAVGHTIAFVDVPVEDRRRFCVTDDEVEQLARFAVAIEKHYGRAMDIEWGRDGVDGQLYIVQARPETVKSRTGGQMQRFTLPQRGRVLIEGRAIGQKIGAGPVRIMKSVSEMKDFEPGQVLVADMTDPDWEPVMKKASAIITNRGGRTCHAAIVARELGIPAVVGTQDATSRLQQGQPVTVSCAEGETGYIYDGILDFTVETTELTDMPALPVKLMMNVATPDQAFVFSQLPNAGVGLARLEFIINHQIGIHPQALLDVEGQPADVKAEIEDRTAAYASPRDFFVKRVAEGVGTIAAAFAPKPVIVRTSDFKSNEYASLLGGDRYEPHEENPMIGYRGASRYVSEAFRESFAMECEALKYVRDEMGLTNLKIMIPFVRTVDEARKVVALLAENGLVQGENDLQLYMMCEIPSNAVLADQFLDIFDGFSIGSNDLTQLTLGLDRDSGIVAGDFDERNDAVKALMAQAIASCKARGKYVGICGQGPSDHVDLAEWLLAQGIESMSLNPDTVVETWLTLAKVAR